MVPKILAERVQEIVGSIAGGEVMSLEEFRINQKLNGS